MTTKEAAVRNAALEEAAQVADGIRYPDLEIASDLEKQAYDVRCNVAASIRALQSHEAAPAATQSAVEALRQIEQLIDSLNCKTICISGSDNTLIDDGIVVADDYKSAFAILHAALSAPAGADWRVPDGFKLAPIEPTRAMIEAADQARIYLNMNSAGWTRAYRAMLDAAPGPKPEGE
jgi:hypothetical protein